MSCKSHRYRNGNAVNVEHLVLGRCGNLSCNHRLGPEINAGRYGVAGDPVPYSIKGDNIITAMLLGGFILALIAFANSRRFIFMQARNFFFESRESKNEMTETTNEYRFQFFFLLQTCLLLSIILFIYTQDSISDTFVLESQYHLIAIFFGSFTAYYITDRFPAARDFQSAVRGYAGHTSGRGVSDHTGISRPQQSSGVSGPDVGGIF